MKSRCVFSALLLLSLSLLVACAGTSSSTNPGDGGSTPKSLAMFSGTYVFLVADRGCVCTFAAAGSVQSDGVGNITSGIIDINHAGSVQQNVPIKGTYTVDTHGRGKADLQSANGTFAFRFVVLSSKHTFVIGFDTNENASGAMELQDSSAVSISSAAGNFAFLVSGTDQAGEELQIGGTITADSSGNISSGVQDVHDNQVIETAVPITPASLSVASTGRGTFTLSSSFAASNYVFYVVDSNHLKIIGMDAGTILYGDAYRQSGTSDQISGSYAFTTFGWTSGVTLPLSAGGVFVTDGNGNVTNGTEDQNNNGSVLQGLSISGQYSLATSGRGTLSLTTASGTTNFAIYPSMSGLQMLEIDSSGITAGSALSQKSSSFSSGSLNGNLGLSTTGSFQGNISDQLAVLLADGNGKLTGTMDLNNERSPESGLAVNGTFSVASNGRGTASLTTSAGTTNLNFYMVDGSLALTLSLDNSAVMTGSLAQN